MHQVLLHARTRSAAGIYFHTKYQKAGWPKAGFEAQVNNSHGDPKRTGSLYAVKNVMDKLVPDNEWFDYYIKVEGKNVVIKINGKTCTDYTEPEDQKPAKGFDRVFNEGTFAFQAHDPGSEVRFKEIQVKRLK